MVLLAEWSAGVHMAASEIEVSNSLSYRYSTFSRRVEIDADRKLKT